MKTHVTFRHLAPSNALRDYVEKKIQRFQKFLHEPIEVHVILQVQKFHQVAEMTVSAKHFRVHGVHESEDMYASIDGVLDKLDRQLRKHKEIVKEHKSVAPTHTAAVELNS